MSFCRFLCLGIFLSSGPGVPAETVTLMPVADATLIETVPDNNLGGAPFVNAGTTQNGPRNRGLFRFAIADAVPRGASIRSARLILEVTRQPVDGFAEALFHLKRVLRPWGEGNKTASDPLHPGLGAPATIDEVTWNHRFALTTNVWAAPGGLEGTDFSPITSSLTFVFGIGDSPYEFGSTPEMRADVQLWLDQPDQNFGWILLPDEEVTRFTARRFGSREDPDKTPLLVIDYFPPLRIERITRSNQQVEIEFIAQPATPYRVEMNSILASSGWSTLTNIAPSEIETTILVHHDIDSAARFFRLVKNPQ